LVTEKYCGGCTPPAAKLKEVAEGVARQVPELTD
jgi:hypothetical protein